MTDIEYSERSDAYQQMKNHRMRKKINFYDSGKSF